MSTQSQTLPKRFLERAEREALRYGSDPWIFLRELVQNSRDAGATEIAFETPNAQSLLCHDDGSGMSRHDIENALLRLYSSNKADSKDSASQLIGRFGVGFWSVLRFKPRLIEVDTQTSSGDASALRIDLDTQTIEEIPPKRTSRGTTLRLWRQSVGPGSLENDVATGIRKWAAFVRGIGDAQAPKILLNGAIKNETLAMPERFATELKTKNVDGYVGFGSRPRVRLYSRGLLVKETSTLEALFPKRHTTFRPAPGLFIDCSLNANHVDLLMNRSTVSENKALEKALRDTENALEKAQYQLLNSLGALPWTLRIWRFRRALIVTFCALLVALLLLVFGALMSERGWGGANAPALPVFALPVMTQATPRALREDVLQNIAPAIDPATESGDNPWALTLDDNERLLLRYVVYDRFEPKRGFINAEADRDPDYRFARSTTVNVKLSADGASAKGYFPLPVPTRARYGKSAFVDGVEQLIEVDRNGQGRVLVPSRVARIEYGFDQKAPTTRGPPTKILKLPKALQKLAKEAAALSKDQRADFIKERLKKRYRYSIDKRDALAFDNANGTFLERLEKTRAGDCDVINNALAATLVSAGIAARIAVGFVANEGQVQGPFHAWAEVYNSKNRTWEVADLSTPVELPPSGDSPAVPDVDGPHIDPGVVPPGVDAGGGSVVESELDTRKSAGEGSPFSRETALYFVMALLSLVLLVLAALWLRKRAAPRPTGVQAVALIAALVRERGRYDRHRIAHRRFFKRVKGPLVSLNTLEKMAHDHSLVLANSDDPLLDNFKTGAQILDAEDAITRALVGTLPGALDLNLLHTWKPAERSQDALGVVARALQRIDTETQIWVHPGQGLAEYSLDTRPRVALGQRHIAIGQNSTLRQHLLSESPIALGQALLAQTTFFRNHHAVVLAAIALELHSDVAGGDRA